MTKTNCVNCNKKINTKKDDHATGESLGEVWCLACTYQDAYEVTQERLDLVELAEVKARMEMEAIDGYYKALFKKHIQHIGALRAENERLRGALDEISDLENFYGHDKSYYQNLLSKAIVISCKALAGESNE